MKKLRKRTSNDALTRKQVRILLDGINEERDKIMVAIGIYSGCRVNELATLRLDKIDWAQGYINVWDDKKNQWSWKNRY